LVTYNGKLSIRTADINTAKLHWNSVISTPNAKYMCLDIKKFYLTMALKYFEYMKMPLDLFPTRFVDQYNLKNTPKMDGCTWKCVAPCGTFPRLVSSPINASSEN
jgi:hypothetical protein